jgi:HEPN domain-containing protein
MQPREEQVRQKLVAQWLSKADLDMRAAEALLSAEPPCPYPSCFHSQQAAEKYLKAFLTWHQVEFPKTHLIGELLDLLATVDASLAESLAGATALNPYGVDVRYPRDQPEPDSAEAMTALALARKVRDAVLRALPLK